MAAWSWYGPGARSDAARSSMPVARSIAVWSQRSRSWSRSSTRSPLELNRAAALPCCSVSNAASPHASAWSGRLVAITSASQTASAPRSRSWVRPVDETKASLYITYTTASTSPSRPGNSAGSGTRSSIRVLTTLRLARTMRCARVCSLTRKARAICGVVRPITARRVRASRASGASAGWQQAKSSAIRSSVPPRSTDGSTRAASASCRPRRRIRSRALRCAAVVSQAAGRSGAPSRRQAVRASTTAPCTASSAMSKSRKRRYRAATRRPDSSRSVAASRSSLELRVVNDHRTDLDPDARQLERRPGLGECDRRVHVGDVDDREAADDLLGLVERSVDDKAAGLDCRGGLDRLQLGAVLVDLVRVVLEPLVDAAVDGLRDLRVGGLVGGRLRREHQHVLHGSPFPSVSSFTLSTPLDERFRQPLVLCRADAGTGRK